MCNRNCPVCGAHWINGQLYWSSGKLGKDEDLAALVCRRLTPGKTEGCVNKNREQPGGVGWEERLAMLNDALSEFNL